MSNGYWTRIHPRDRGVWSWPQSTVHCFALPHCSANQISCECFLDITCRGGGGGLRMGEMWNGKTWHNKSVPSYATVFEGPKPFLEVSL